MGNTFHFGVLEDHHVHMVNGEDGPMEVCDVWFSVGCGSMKGENWVLCGFHAKDEAKATAELAALVHNPESLPEAWFVTAPCYGSEAWDCEAEYDLACFEADAFNEPRPHW